MNTRPSSGQLLPVVDEAMHSTHISVESSFDVNVPDDHGIGRLGFPQERYPSILTDSAVGSVCSNEVLTFYYLLGDYSVRRGL